MLMRNTTTAPNNNLEYCASIALGDCDDDGDELDVREIVDVGKDLGRIV